MTTKAKSKKVANGSNGSLTVEDGIRQVLSGSDPEKVAAEVLGTAPASKAYRAAKAAKAAATKADKAEKAKAATKAAKPAEPKPVKLSAEEAKLLLRCRSLAGKLRHRVRINRGQPGSAKLTSMTDRLIMDGRLEELAAHMMSEIEARAAKKSPKDAAHAEATA